MPPKGTGRRKRIRFETESESSPNKIAKKSKAESEDSSATVRSCIAAQPSIVAQPRQDRVGYGLPSSASGFRAPDVEAMKVTFRGASAENVVIPEVEVKNFPNQYILTGINRTFLRKPDFNVNNLDHIDNSEVLTFIYKLHDITENSGQLIGASETHTDSLVDDLLRIVGFNTWPLMIKNNLPCLMYIADEPVVSSKAKFVIKKQDIHVLVVKNKHLKNVGYGTRFGETQIAIEILAYASMNIRNITPRDQTVWAVRVIATYVTFYKATISALYWSELEGGLPVSQGVTIERWPADNGLMTGFDLAEPTGRISVLTALLRIRETLLSEDSSERPSTSHSAMVPQDQQGQSSTSHIAMVPQNQQEEGKWREV